jgi:hypothetical protein
METEETKPTLEDEMDELDWAGPAFDEPAEADTPAETAEAVTEKVAEPVVDAAPPVVEPVAVTPSPSPPPQDDMVAYLRDQVEQLNRQLLEATNQRQAPSPKQPVQTPPLAQAQTPVTPSAAPEEDYDYTGGIDLDDITTDPKAFNDVLKKVEARVRMAVAQEAAQSALLSIPDVVQHQIKQQAALNKLVETFYEENEDLKSVNHTVGMVAQNISSEHPDWTVKQVFDAAAAQTRTLLRMPAPTEARTPAEPLKPAFAQRPGGRDRAAGTVNVSALQKQLDEL